MNSAPAGSLPRHIGIIPDGNRRWAKANGLPSIEGHRRGVETFREICLAALDRGVEYLTYFAFSTENWQRAADEVKYLMDLFVTLAIKEGAELDRRGVRLKVLGRRDGLSDKLLKALDEAEARTATNTKGTLALCLNYGGEQELADAAAAIVREGTKPEDVTPELLASHLYAPELPPVDLVIRTSGEQRLSGFMLWRAAYAEFYFVEQHWPEFKTADLDAALADYANRQRRYGR